MLQLWRATATSLGCCYQPVIRKESRTQDTTGLQKCQSVSLPLTLSMLAESKLETQLTAKNFFCCLATSYIVSCVCERVSVADVQGHAAQAHYI